MPQLYIREALQRWWAGPSGENLLNMQAALGHSTDLIRRVVDELADLLFFASLKTEEGDPVRVAVAWSPRGAAGLATLLDEDPDYRDQFAEPAWDVLGFADPVPLDSDALAKASVFCDFGTAVVVVGGDPLERMFWDGVASRSARSSGGPALVLAAPAPGTVTLISFRTEFFRFESGTVIDQTPDVFEAGPVATTLEACAAPLHLTPEFLDRSPVPRFVRSLVQRMAHTGRGGLLLIKSSSNRLDAARKAPGLRCLAKPLELGERLAVLQNAKHRSTHLAWNEADPKGFPYGPSPMSSERVSATQDYDEAGRRYEEVIERVARLTAADNAVLLGPAFEVVGAQYQVPNSPLASGKPLTIVEAVGPSGPDLSSRPFDLARHGSRHHAAANFAWSNEDGVAFLASSDGPLKCFRRMGEVVAVWHLRVPDV